MIKELESLGLTHNEAVVYEALCGLGETKIGPLVKATKQHRVIAYNALEQLIDKGLVSFVTKENIKYFQATQASRIADLVDEMKRVADNLVAEVQELQQASLSQQEVSVFSGLRGLKSAMNSLLKGLVPNSKLYVFASGQMSYVMGSYYDFFQEEKRRKKIKTFGIGDVEFAQDQEVLDRTAAEVRFFPFSSFPIDTWIYGEYVLIAVYTAVPPIAIRIHSKETADAYMKLFESIWARSKTSIG